MEAKYHQKDAISIDDAGVESLKQKHTAIFCGELGDKLSKYYIDGMYGAMQVSSKGEVAEAGERLFYHLARDTFGPMMCAFSDWTVKSYSGTGKDGKVLFIARDGLLNYEIAKTLVEEKPEWYPGLSKENLGVVYLTRKLAGEADEIARFERRATDEHRVATYLEQTGVNKDALLVDMGMYGTLYNKGCKVYWDEKPALVFFYSKNPNVMGFVNLLAGRYGGEGYKHEVEHLGNILVDSMESATPHQHKSPSMLKEDNGRLLPVLEEIDDALIQRWHIASMQGYVDSAKDYIIRPANAMGEIQRLRGLHLSAHRAWNGMLPEITPEWSLKKAFLKNEPEYRTKTGSEGFCAGSVPPMGTEMFKVFEATAQEHRLKDMVRL